ncbi:hypothetical protein QJS04_geneDACA017894 [Acorus gramineus]|uniref:LOB domain-containing protein n=1 Tax=Acorus gramineus TaxID=55184 RepID=A0AAV9ALL5_ACOGR|nr:hypothetical protein QJS04_geneDACA017894 [Acorus gramineus]
MKILNSVPSARERDRAMQSIIFEAGARRCDPVHGVVGILRGLFDRVEAQQMELESLRRQIAFQKCFRLQRAQMGMFSNVGFHMPKPNSRVEDMYVKPFNTAVAANGGMVDFKNEISGGIDCKDFKRSRIIARKISYI